MSALLELTGLTVELESTGDPIVEDISFSLAEGEVMGLVGESGSGKTTTGVALLGYVRRGARIRTGTVTVGGQTVYPASQRDLRAARGKIVAYIPQDPAAALNPSLRIGTLIEETLTAHDLGSAREARAERVRQLMSEVKLPSDPDFLARFPHQLSGGQQQRVCIAIAIACEPRVLVLDEPTTGLDVTTQAHVLETLHGLTARHRMAAVYVTHDLAVVASMADTVMVMYSGRVVELADRRTLFANPAHPYTGALIGAIPDVKDRRPLTLTPGTAPGPSSRPGGCTFAPRCELVSDACRAAEPATLEVDPGHHARCIRIDEFRASSRIQQPASTRVVRGEQVVLEGRDLCVDYGPVRVLHSVAFQLKRGECLAVVGESGSGKTTMSRAVVGLVKARQGKVLYEGRELPQHVRDYPEAARRGVQYIFQSPYRSLNPRRTIRAILASPAALFFGAHGRVADERILSALERVSLSSRVLQMTADQLSGGERQRVAIARALICEPRILLCDEITSALDVSVQASIVGLLGELQRQEQLSLLFVTHNMGLVRHIADRVMVLESGYLIETGDVDTLLDRPSQDYTRTLVANTPTIASAAPPADTLNAG